MLSRGELTWIDATDIEETSTDWLWWPYIAAENINIIAGMGNEGKGLVCAHLAACVSRGNAFPYFPEKHEPGGVLWLEMEDDLGSTVVPRLKAARAVMQNIRMLDPNSFIGLSPSQHIESIATSIKTFQPRLVILSPMNSFLGGANVNSELEVRAAFEALRTPTIGTGCAILGIAHANKKTELTSIERISGSVAYVNYCRSVMFVATEPFCEGGQQRRLVHGKWNMSTRGDDLLYTPKYVGSHPKQRDQYVRLEWDKPLEDVNVKSVFSQQEKKAKETAPQWMERVLAEKTSVDIATLKEDAKKAGHSWRSVEIARQRLNDKHEELFIDSKDGIWTLGRRSF